MVSFCSFITDSVVLVNLQMRASSVNRIVWCNVLSHLREYSFFKSDMGKRKPIGLAACTNTSRKSLKHEKRGKLTLSLPKQIGQYHFRMNTVESVTEDYGRIASDLWQYVL